MAYTDMNTAFVSAEGDYSAYQRVIVFNPHDLSDDQWETLSGVSDRERIHFIEACLNGRDTSEWEG
jgi:hypothetical protein